MDYRQSGNMNRQSQPLKPVRRKKRRRLGPLFWGFLLLASVAVGGFFGFLVLSSRLTGHAPGEVLRNLVDMPFGGKSSVTLLLLGVDDKVENGRSDTMILAHINLKSKEIHAISIPRDTRIQIPGQSHFEKINAAYSHGGAKLTEQTVIQLLGVPIDGYVKTNIAGFKGLVDTIGGVDLYVDKRMHYTDRAQGLFINLRKGYQHLDGEKAMEFVRFRRDVMGDLTRVQRQQRFMRAVAQKLMEPASWPKIPGIIARSREFVETDLMPRDLETLARMARSVKPESIQMGTLPGVPQNIGGVSYFVVDETKKTQTVQALLQTPATTGTAGQTAELPRPAVQVLNGSGLAGLAAKASAKLRESGYQVIGTGNADSFNYSNSQIIAGSDSRDGAQPIARILGCGTVVISPTATAGSPVRVILGKDYQPLD